MPYDNFVLTLARTPRRRGRAVRAAPRRGTHPAVRGRFAVHQSRARQRRQCAAVGQHRERERVARRRGAVRRSAPGASRRATIPRVSTRLAPVQDACSSCSACGSSGCSARRGCARRPSWRHDPSEAELVRRAGGLIARTVAPHHTACACSITSSPRVARAARRAAAPGARTRRAVAMARAPRRDPAAGARSAESLVRGCACRAQGCRSYPAESSRQPGTTAENMNTPVATFEQSVQRELARVIVGAEDVIRALCIALIARGHVLVQGPPGLGKTLAREDARARARRRVQARAGHGGSHAQRHRRHARVRRVEERVRVPARPAVRGRAAGRRDQPHRPQDAVGAARGHGRAAGVLGARPVSAAGGLPGAGDAEPARVRRHLSTARSRSSTASCCAST